jgi:hypothetical protein
MEGWHQQIDSLLGGGVMGRDLIEAGYQATIEALETGREIEHTGDE